MFFIYQKGWRFVFYNIPKSNGKITQIKQTKTGVLQTIDYTYDASGNRISKKVGAQTTWYVRDASGNTMAVYSIGDNTLNSGKITLLEQHIYGSSRLGIRSPKLDVSSLIIANTSFVPLSSKTILSSFDRGATLYSLSNHLGNELVTISDKRMGHDAGNGTIDYYNADVVGAQDYAPFGMQLVGRKFSSLASGYRYGFNGKENDNEVKGDGDQQDYGMRIYDPRIGKFLSVDPLTPKYPELTPYQFASNTPIQAIDLDGAEGAYHNSRTGQTLVGPVNHEIVSREAGWSCNPCNPLPPPRFAELQKAANIPIPKLKEEEVIVQDIYGTSHFGKRSVVESRVSAIKQEYNQAVGENIRGGLGGAIGYLAGGDKGSFVGAAGDQILFSFSGIPGSNSSVLSKPGNTATEAYIPFTNTTAFGSGYNVKNTVRLGAFSNFKNLEELAPQFFGRNLENASNNLLGNGWTQSTGNFKSKTVFEKTVGNTMYYAMWEPANMEHSTDGKPTSYWKITQDKIRQTNDNKVKRVPLSSNFRE